jgi:NADPH2:quinone reductase
MLRCTAVAQRDEQVAQLGALLGAQAGEDGVLGVSLCLGGALEVALTRGGERDDVTAAVGGVAVAREEPVRFERVEQRHEDARVGGHGLAQLALTHRPVVVQQPEQLELPRHEVVRGVGVAQATHRVLAQKREKEPGARTALFKHAGDMGGRFRSHAHNVAVPIVDLAILLREHLLKPTREKHMKAITLNEAGRPPAARDDLPTPTPGPRDVLIRVQASSANPVDNSIAAGTLAGMGVEHEYPVILDRDYAGVVEEVGDQVIDYAAGDEVFGFLLHANPTVRDGSWAELITVSDDASIARRPAGIDVVTAGAAPLAAITAVSAIDALDLSEGDTVLIVGATGGVGSLAVQLAARAGATIVAPALQEDEQYLRDLGVTEVVPREGDVAAAVRERFPDGVDALLDLVNYTPGSYDAALKDGARIASPTGAAGEGPGRTMVVAQPTTGNLGRVAQLLDSGALEVPVQDTYPLDRATEALQALGASHTRGKRVIRVS